MDIFLQQLLNALSLGGTYALLALGLAVVFSIIGLINFAHGELMTTAGYVMAFSLAAAVPFPLAIVVAVAAPVAMAMAMERVAFRPVRGASGTTLLLTSFAVSAILRVLFQNFITARPVPVPMPSALSGVISIGPLHLGIIQSISIATTALMLIGLTLFLTGCRCEMRENKLIVTPRSEKLRSEPLLYPHIGTLPLAPAAVRIPNGRIAPKTYTPGKQQLDPFQ